MRKNYETPEVEIVSFTSTGFVMTGVGGNGDIWEAGETTAAISGIEIPTDEDVPL